MKALRESRALGRLIFRSRVPGETHGDRVRRQVRALAIGNGAADAAIARAIGVTAPVLCRYLAGERRSAPAAAGLAALEVDACPCGAVDCGGCKKSLGGSRESA